MAIARRGSAVNAHGPTGLWRYLPISLVATAVVAGLPMWTLLTFGRGPGLLGTALSVVLSFALSDLGARAWKRWPGSRDVVFNDLMLWGYCRRIITQQRLARKIERLGSFAGDDVDGLTLEERTALIKKLAIALETGDPYTHGHSQRVARHAYLVARTMKLPRADAEKIRLAGVIHDVGKLRVPREIITKPGALTDAEFDVVKQHTVDGAVMVEGLRDPELIDMVRHHHERLDGSGYPDKLSGDDISVGARILAVADTFDAASSPRPYRAAQKHQVALDILQAEAARGRLDAHVVDAFVRYYSGGRALRWWAFLYVGPVNLYKFSLSVGQRLGEAGLANAAIVGITAVALAPGYGFGIDRPERTERAKEKRVAASTERDEPAVEERSPSQRARSMSSGTAQETSPMRTGAGPAGGNSGSKDSRDGRSGNGSGRPAHASDPGSKSRSENAGPKDKDAKEPGPATGDQGPSTAVADTVEENTADNPAAASAQVTDVTPGAGKDADQQREGPPLPDPATENAADDRSP